MQGYAKVSESQPPVFLPHVFFACYKPYFCASYRWISFRTVVRSESQIMS